jgi:integrase
MPARPRVPAYRHHKSTGRAVVTLNGRDVYLGAYGTIESRERYARVIREWEAAGRQLVTRADDLSVDELVAHFWTWAQSYYRKADGTPSGELQVYHQALRPLRRLYGKTLANDFSSLALEALQAEMISLGWARGVINKQIGRARRVFKWGAKKKLVRASVWHELQTVEGLKRGRTDAHETEPVAPVPQAFIDAVLPLVGRHVAAMIRLQLLTGMRPSEVCAMRGRDIDTTGKLWTYTPAEHKNSYRGQSRIVYLGPRAQEILAPFLRTDVSAYLFSPADAEAERRERMHAERVTPLSYGNAPGTNRRRRPLVRPGVKYTAGSYRKAIHRACDRADEWAKGGVVIGEDERLVPRWSPNRLRHNAATYLRKEFGLEAAQVILGHATLTVTQVYAEKNVEAARSIMQKIG